ncbi:response regulator transcription factor [Puia dinghuensis]|uniref:Transcriptional regulatory protein RprY n=1 Tax=Puia dinghuensis TaxID=1792502 RepID=A0A8J2UDU7_9BACT|nr:response regulator transcription factor [Puia dinghuensis]GGB03723.1 transcriptional regulatory protein RprY [Puia dinghuensis]
MSRIKVLYAEDEIFLGKIVKETLESRGFEVLMETNGARVLAAFENGMPDICVLDIMLPDRNGFEVAEAIRARNDDVPIIFLTAKTQTDDLVRGFRTGGNDYIRKPFSMEELIVRIENCLRVRKDASPAAGPLPQSLMIGNFVFHLNRQVLTGGEVERKLSYRESELLRQLWLHRDHVIAREDILQAIWGNDSFLNSRNLDVYITKLRSYLKADERVEILTIKGIGYRFVLP